MISIAVSDIIEDVRQRCDLDEYTSTTFVTTTAILRLVQESAQRLSGILHESWGDDYFATVGIISTTENQATADLPTNSYRVLNVAWQKSATDYRKLERAQPEEIFDLLAITSGWTNLDAPKYQVQGNSLRLWPIPTTRETLYVYHTTGIFITSSGDTFNGQVGWAEWITLDVCKKIAQREEKDDAQYIRAQALVEQSIRASAPRRDRNAVYQVRGIDDPLPRHLRTKRIWP